MLPDFPFCPFLSRQNNSDTIGVYSFTLGYAFFVTDFVGDNYKTGYTCYMRGPGIVCHMSSFKCQEDAYGFFSRAV